MVVAVPCTPDEMDEQASNGDALSDLDPDPDNGLKETVGSDSDNGLIATVEGAEHMQVEVSQTDKSEEIKDLYANDRDVSLIF